jgi:hypothetical protein
VTRVTWEIKILDVLQRFVNETIMAIDIIGSRADQKIILDTNQRGLVTMV